jgi:hypothetical protein
MCSLKFFDHHIHITYMKDITEAKRYISNAKEILREKAIKENGVYKDRKYVKMAGHTAYAGVLVALDSVLGDKKKKTRKSVEWYQKELSELTKKYCLIFSQLTTHYISR